MGGVEDVCGDAASSVALEGLGDLGVLFGVVGVEEDDVVIFEELDDLIGGEGIFFVYLAGEAPGGGEVDEDGAALGAEFLEVLRGEFFPDEAAFLVLSWDVRDGGVDFCVGVGEDDAGG